MLKKHLVKRKERSKLKRHLPLLLVFGQFSSLFFIIFSGPILANAVWRWIQLLSLIVGVWAILVMHIGNFNITPTPVKGGVFRSGGPYRLIRHPMYASLFLFVIPEIISDFSYLRAAGFVVLSFSLFHKMNYEEIQLKKQFVEYDGYMKNTKRIIPFIY